MGHSNLRCLQTLVYLNTTASPNIICYYIIILSLAALWTARPPEPNFRNSNNSNSGNLIAVFLIRAIRCLLLFVPEEGSVVPHHACELVQPRLPALAAAQSSQGERHTGQPGPAGWVCLSDGWSNSPPGGAGLQAGGARSPVGREGGGEGGGEGEGEGGESREDGGGAGERCQHAVHQHWNHPHTAAPRPGISFIHGSSPHTSPLYLHLHSI